MSENVADELAKLVALRDSGVLSPQEFEAQKQRLLSPQPTIPPPVAPTPVAAVAPVPPPAKKKAGCSPRIAAFVVLVVIVIVVIAVVAGGGSSANIKTTVNSVVPLDGNTLRVYMTFTNTGKGSGTGNCVMQTAVYNQFGDQVNTRTNSTGPNSSLKPGASVKQYQDIGVDNGDAQYEKASDVTVSC